MNIPIKIHVKLVKDLKEYQKKFLVKKYQQLDESATRLMVNHFLTDILGYLQLDEIKTEYAIKGTYADYVIQLERKKRIIIEVKAIQINIEDQHIRQALNYAANEGIDWVLLTNGRTFELHKVIFSKPIANKKVFSFDLAVIKDFNVLADDVYYMTKQSMRKNQLDYYWKVFQALEPKNLAKDLFDGTIVRYLRKKLKTKTNITFIDSDIVESLYQVIVQKIEVARPKGPSQKKTQRKTQRKRSVTIVTTNVPISANAVEIL